MALFLLDAMGLVYRGHYAFLKNPRRTSQGLQTSAIFGTLNTLVDLWERYQWKYVAVAWDSPQPTWREKTYASYKAHRQATPPDIIVAEKYLKQLIEALGIHQAHAPGFEADDILVYWARQALPHLTPIYIVSGDKDLAQVVSDHIYLLRPAVGKSPEEILNPQKVQEKFGVAPSQIPDLLALMGDATDGIPGIPKVGEKTAHQLLSYAPSVEALYEKLSELPPAMQQKIAPYKEIALLSKKLATVQPNEIPLPFEIASFQLRPINWEKTEALLRELEMLNLLRRLENLFARPQSVQLESQNYTSICSPEELSTWLGKFSSATVWALDTETTAAHPYYAEWVGFSLSSIPHTGAFVFFPTAEAIASYLPVLQKFLDKISLLVGQNLKYDLAILQRHGLKVPPADKLFDTLLADYLLDPEAPHSLEVLAQKHLGRQAPLSYKEMLGKLKPHEIRKVPLETLTKYACSDADLTIALYQPLKNALHASPSLEKLFYEVEMPLLHVLLHMEETGIYVDEETLDQIDKEISHQLSVLENQIYALAGHEFNLNSPIQLGQVLYEELKLIPAKKTPTGQPSTDEESLQKLAQQHELPAAILRYRSLYKLRSTYVEGLRKGIHPDTGRVHTVFQQAQVATGRLSSQNPNLQNIPIRTEEGALLRKAFAAQKPYQALLSADYSQIELRILAAFTGDENLLEAFRQGHDVHARTAEKLFGEVTPHTRRIAKSVNFGILYGITAFGLAQQLRISRSEAQAFIQAYFSQYPAVKTWIETHLQKARQVGYVETLLGRRRYIPTLNSENKTEREAAERLAINAPIQGTAADIVKVAMIRIAQHLQARGYRSRMLLQIHDELLFEVHPDEMLFLPQEIKKLMENSLSLPHQVPLVVETTIGPNWLEMH
ncbi:MAG: DNA polymerase I [Bacteroidia bacterium]